MLNLYVKVREAAYRLGADERGAISFEYLIVAAAVVGLATAAYNGGVATAFTSAIGKLTTAISSAP